MTDVRPTLRVHIDRIGAQHRKGDTVLLHLPTANDAALSGRAQVPAPTRAGSENTASARGQQIAETLRRFCRDYIHTTHYEITVYTDGTWACGTAVQPNAFGGGTYTLTEGQEGEDQI